MKNPQSLLLITVDCLRADHTGFLGYQRQTTPFLDSLAKDSLIFRNAVAAGVPTFYAFPAIMASRHPLALGRDVAGLAPGEETLATTLQEANYTTAAFLAGNPYLSKRFGYDAGFDTFTDYLDGSTEDFTVGPSREPEQGSSLNRSIREICHYFGPTGRFYDELYFRYCQWIARGATPSFDDLRRFPSASVIVDRACDWVRGVAGSPFFLWLHFMDPHGPYYPPAEALRQLGCSVDASRARYLNSHWNRGELSPRQLAPDRKEIIDLYDSGIRWVDTQIERLVGELQRLGVWDRCVMAVTADHGEEFLEHGGRFHSPSQVFDELAHVPLLIRTPELKSGQSVTVPFCMVDLSPTLLEALDVPVPFNFRGTSRWSFSRDGESWDQPVVTECVATCKNPFSSEKRLGPRILSVRDSRYKLVLDFGSSSASLFDLDKDPRELEPLPPKEEKPVCHRLMQSALRHLADSLQSRDHDHHLAARLRDIRLEWAQPSVPRCT